MQEADSFFDVDTEEGGTRISEHFTAEGKRETGILLWQNSNLYFKEPTGISLVLVMGVGRLQIKNKILRYRYPGTI